MGDLAIDVNMKDGKISSLKIRCSKSKKLLQEIDYIEDNCKIISKQYTNGEIEEKVLNCLR